MPVVCSIVVVVPSGGAAFTVSVRLALCWQAFASVTVTVKLTLPCEPAGGVPESKPAVVIASHDGAEETAHCNGVASSFAENCCEYKTPTVAGVNVVGEIVIVGQVVV